MPSEDDEALPNLVTIIGSGVPSNYEISVVGTSELVGADPLEEATLVSENAAEGAVATGVLRFRFSGEMANVRLVDWNGVAAPESPHTPEVHINYNAPVHDNRN